MQDIDSGGVLNYDELAEQIRSGKVVTVNGRTAHTIDDLDFIVQCDDTTKGFREIIVGIQGATLEISDLRALLAERDAEIAQLKEQLAAAQSAPAIADNADPTADPPADKPKKG